MDSGESEAGDSERPEHGEEGRVGGDDDDSAAPDDDGDEERDDTPEFDSHPHPAAALTSGSATRSAAATAGLREMP